MAGESSPSAEGGRFPGESSRTSTVASPDSPEYELAKSLLSSMKLEVLQKLQSNVQSEIDKKLQLQI